MEKRYMLLENQLCKELSFLEEKYRTGADMTEGDLRRIDLLTHALKSLATFVAMKESEMQGYGNSQTSMSYGNSMNNNSYNNPSYMDNSYGMRGMRSHENNPDMSGHYPIQFPMRPEERRW